MVKANERQVRQPPVREQFRVAVRSATQNHPGAHREKKDKKGEKTTKNTTYGKINIYKKYMSPGSSDPGYDRTGLKKLTLN